MRRTLALILLGVTLAPAAAYAKPAVALHLSGVYVRTVEGKEQFVPVEREAATTGAIIRYDISAKNGGDSVAKNVVAAGRIPAGTAFKDVSGLAAGAHVEYTVDGKTWSPAPTIVVKAADGSMKTVKAPLSAYTAIRFAGAAIKAGATADYAYEVVVK